LLAIITYLRTTVNEGSAMAKKGRILVVDDNRNVLSALRIFLENHFEHVALLPSPSSLVSALGEQSPDVVLLDMNFSAGINSGNEGLYWLSEIKRHDAELPVVLFTAYADIELAVRALKDGASDFVVKPWDNHKLLATLKSALELRLSRREVRRLREKQSTLNIARNTEGDEVCWGVSHSMRELLAMLRKVAATDANVLITGENGTGKELIAKKIHNLSPRSAEPLVSVDLGALTESLFESELFGHVKGAFTDARADRAGKFEAADGGTLFLDEIGNLSFALQAKLLTALQSRRVTRVGSNTPVEVDIRLVAATNRNLPRMVAAGEFREDLMYRLNTITVEVPPLRERREDIAPLSRFFLDRFAKKYGKRRLELSPAALSKLHGHRWPGNVRELQHALEKAVILADGEELGPADFRFNTAEERADILEAISIEDMERMLIEKTVRRNNRNLSTAAAQLGISRPTLYARMKKYGLE
jgi:DNA-binding NtrC family response regulator